MATDTRSVPDQPGGGTGPGAPAGAGPGTPVDAAPGLPRRWRPLVVVLVVVVLGLVVWAVAHQVRTSRTQLDSGFFMGPTTITGAPNASVSTPFWSGHVIQIEDRITIERMISVFNEGPRALTVTDVDGLLDDLRVEAPGGDRCRLGTDTAEVAFADEASYMPVGDPVPFDGDLVLEPGVQALFWLTGTFRGGGPDCGPDAEASTQSVLFDYTVGGREDFAVVEAPHLVFTGDLEAWLDGALTVTRDGG